MGEGVGRQNAARGNGMLNSGGLGETAGTGDGACGRDGMM